MFLKKKKKNPIKGYYLRCANGERLDIKVTDR